MNDSLTRFNALLVGGINPSPMEELVLSKLVRVLGKDKTVSLLDESMRAARLEGVGSAQELLTLSNELIKRPGFPAIVGRSLKVFAILRGASE
jgi:hypothetical protein